MKAIELVRGLINDEIFDYGLLCDALKSYAKPRDAISRLLKQGSIIRVKKGLYVFGKHYRRAPLCLEPLANLIYGPSYISLEYALRLYGLIPEKVVSITSITSQRGCIFKTPVGVFEYQHLDPNKVSVGVIRYEINSLYSSIIATPEKALADRLATHRNLKNISDLHQFITEGLRIEEDDLKSFRLPLLKEIASVYKNPIIDKLVKVVEKL